MTLQEMGITDSPPELSPDARLWSAKGVVAYRLGDRPDPVAVFTRVVAVIDRYIDCKRSLSSQRAMCELVACDIIVTGMSAKNPCLPGCFADCIYQLMKVSYLLAKTI
jgi:hypothetical protein